MAPRDPLQTVATALEDAVTRRFPGARVSATVRHWADTLHLDTLVRMDHAALGSLHVYEQVRLAGPRMSVAGGTDPLVAQVLGRLDARITVHTVDAHTVEVALTDPAGVPLRAPYVRAEGASTGGVTVTAFWPEGPPQPLWTQPHGFPSQQRLVDAYCRLVGPRASVRAAIPTGTYVTLRGTDAEAFFAPSDSEPALRAALAHACQTAGWPLTHVAVKGPGCFVATVDTEVGPITNHVSVRPLLGPLERARLGAEWLVGLLHARVEPLPAGRGRPLGCTLVVPVGTTPRPLATLTAERTPVMLVLRGRGSGVPSDIGLMPKRTASPAALAHALLSAYQGPWQARVNTPTGPTAIPQAPHLAPEDQMAFRQTRWSDGPQPSSGTGPLWDKSPFDEDRGQFDEHA